MIGNEWMLKCCYIIDSLYQNDKFGFSDNVEHEEQRLIEIVELLRLAGEREKEARTLKERADRPVRKP